MQDSGVIPRIIEKIQQEEAPLSAERIAQEFLAIPPSPVSATLVKNLLGKEPGFEQTANGDWTFTGTFEQESSLGTELLCCYITATEDHQILSLSCAPLKESEEGISFVNPQFKSNLPFAEQTTVEVASLGEGLTNLVDFCRGKAVLFFSQLQQRVLQKYLNFYGLNLTDNTTLLSNYFKLAQVTMSNFQSGLTAVAENCIAVERPPVNSSESVVLLMQLVNHLLVAIEKQGIKTDAALTNAETNTFYNAQWQQATFSLEDVVHLTEGPGVYGFQDANGTFIYVGKGSNLRRRVLSYFRVSDESPQKLTQLRNSAVSFTHVPCGTELEALLLENRLIQKHKPQLNTQIEVKLDNTPMPAPMILLLPSTEEGLCQTLWIGAGPKLVMKKLPYFSDEQFPLQASELEQFFYTKQVEQQPDSEKIITARHLQLTVSRYDRIEVDSAADSTALLNLLQRSLEVSDGSGTLFR